jgi:hypothetical protein
MLDKATSQEVRSKIRAIFMAEWDPIGVNEVPEAADEYDSYIGGLYDLLEQGASEESIRTYLRQIEIDQMGMVNASREPLLSDANRNRAAGSLTSLGRYFR